MSAQERRREEYGNPVCFSIGWMCAKRGGAGGTVSNIEQATSPCFNSMVRST
jgi:hypothetical protein